VIDQYLPRGSRARQVALFAAIVVAALLLTQVVFPGRGATGRGTPAAILFSGAVQGLVTALSAVGLVLVYRTTRVINFSQAAMGAAGGAFVFDMVQYEHGVPFIVDLVLGLLLAGLVGLLFELVFVRRFFHAPRLVLVVISIAAGKLLADNSARLVLNLPLFPKSDTLSAASTFGTVPIRTSLPFSGFHFQVGSFPQRFGFPELLAIELSIMTFLALAAFFRYTRAGVAVRAMAENSERAALLGISVGVMSSIVWVIAAVLSGVTVTVTGAMSIPGAGAGLAPATLLVAFTAAVIGRMRNLPTTIAASVVLSVLLQSATWSYNDASELIFVVLALVIMGALLLQRKEMLRSEAGEISSWSAIEELRPIPKELAGVSSVRTARYVGIGVFVVFLGVLPFVTSTGTTNLAGGIAIAAMVGLSLVVLTGWAGQVSLGQYGFAAVGAIAAAGMTQRAHVPFFIAILLAAAIAGAVAVVVGLPALRIRGLFLLVVTFAFGVVSVIFFDKRYFGWVLPKQVQRPTLFFLDFEDERSMYFLCVAALLLVIVVLLNLRRSRFGRLLIAARESEANVQSFGVSVVRLKLMAFAASGAIAGFAGAIFVHQQRGVSPTSFGIGFSIDVFIFVVIGGIGSIWGALLGAAYTRGLTYFVPDPQVQFYLVDLGVVILLYILPGGLVSAFAQMRDAALRVVAQRHQIVVPSLFADYDVDALEHRLIPLAEAADNAGLAALAPARRFALRSDLYRGRGIRIVDRLAGKKASEETTAIGSAARSAGDIGAITPGTTS